jgi:hypothetical protein
MATVSQGYSCSKLFNIMYSMELNDRCVCMCVWVGGGGQWMIPQPHSSAGCAVIWVPTFSGH